MRFGQIGKDGVFNRLDLAGVLSHHVPEVAGVDAATTDPPSSGRARLRGQVVRKHGLDPGYKCSWDAILDLHGKRILDLSDPFANKGEVDSVQSGEARIVADHAGFYLR